jgi:hypothetical protein
MTTIRERTIEWLGGVTAVQLQEVQQQIETAVNRAYEAGYGDAGNDEPPQGELRSFSYRVMGDSSGVRDFSKIDRARVLEEVWALWQSSPIARRVMAIKRDHIIGRNAVPKTDDDNLQKLYATFWRKNKLDRRVKEFCLQLFLLGEQCYTANVRRTDGFVKLGYIDPAQIERVITHPDNAMENWAVVLVEQTAVPTQTPWVKDSGKRKVYRIIREDEGAVRGSRVTQPKYEDKLVTHEQASIEDWEMAMLTHFGLSEYTGSCFYEKVNSVSNHPRGYSDLTQVGDWIEEAEKTLYGIADREQIAAYFFMVATIKGDRDDVAWWKSYFAKNPPKKWGITAVNEEVVLEVKQPDLGQQASIASFVAILTLIMGGVGYPLSWYGYGSDTNRATLDKQADPTEKSLAHDQDLFKDHMLTILRFVRDQAEIAGTGSGEYKGEIDLALGEINPQNIHDLVSAFMPVVQAMIAAKDNGLLREQTAVEVIAKVLAEAGQKVDAKEELERIKAEKEEKETADVGRRNGQLQDRMKVVNGNDKEPEEEMSNG